MLTLLLLLPLAALLAFPLLPSSSPWARRASALVCGAQLLITLWLGLHPVEELRRAWLPQLGLEFHLGLDGLSLPLVGLTALITLLSVAESSPEEPRGRLFYGLLLAADFGLTGAFLARNALLFVLAFEITLIPTTLLLAIWGGERRATAAIRYLMYGAVSGVALLAGVLALGLLNTNGFSFAYDDLAQVSLPPGSQRWIMGLLLLAFGLKMPVLPLHGWQPLAYSQASTPVAMQLSGVVSKLGAYGLLRFAVGMMGDTWAAWAPAIAVLGMVSALYGALNAIAQTDMRRLVAYSSLGHMGLLMLAISAASPLSLQGAMAQILAHGLITSLLFCLVGMIETRTGTSEIAGLSGLLNPCRGLPFTSGLFLLALMASAGVPGQAGFVAEMVIYQGSFTLYPIPTLGCLLASGLTAVYAVRLFNRVGFGRLDNALADYSRTSWQERVPALSLSMLVIVAGLWPNLLLGWSEGATASLALTHPSPSVLVAALPSAAVPQAAALLELS
ncbi:NuoM family protein [Synechococcus sp. CS-603]|uniref:complex I subunit 4 family protein n=1 Tax=Synechococcus sp. CS-603 TaxID=2847981 RepID=UPI00223B3443|nr:NADH-quinone oxidoreductase subunit M [Synechococcus sp. CS-603]MCT0202414.1 NADH-quinone oxidoreductase subunit M [Synechococcus sp. CS-603]